MDRLPLVAILAFTAVAASADTVTVGLYAVGDTKGASSLSPRTKTLTVGQAPADTLRQLSDVSRTGYTLATNEWKASLYSSSYDAGLVFDSAWCAQNATDDVKNSLPQARWTMLVVPVTPNPYTVTFDKNGGMGSMSAQSFVYDAPQNLSSNAFTRTGYTFAHWSGLGSRTFADGEVVSNLTATAGGTVALTAQWTANTYRITLDAGESDTPGTAGVDAEYGRTFPAITLPTRGGYSFKGYYTQPDGQGDLCYRANGTPCTSYLAADVTIYACWAKNPTVTFHIYEGTFLNGWTAVTNYVEGVGMSLPDESDVVYADHTFAGWYDNEAFEGLRVTSIPSTATGDKTFYARWEGKTYNVSFDANGGEGRGEQKLSMTNSDKLKTLAELFIQAPQGYTFKEWNVSADGSGDSYADGAVIQNNLTSVANATVTLYAQWTPNPYEVAFDPNGADGGETMGNQSFTYDEAQNLSPVGFTYTGHAFERWSSDTNYNYQTKYYADGAEVANLTAVSNDVVTLYANWTGIVYTVSFDANGGAGTMAPMPCIYDVPTNLPACAFTRDGWGFKGWVVDGADGVLLADRARVTNLTATAGTDVALLACWTGVTYAVTLDVRDPRGDGTLTNDVGEAVSMLTNRYTVGDAWELPTPANDNEHLSFDGWKYVDAHGRKKDVPAEVPPPSAGMTNLVAVWSWIPDALAVAVNASELEFSTFGTAGDNGTIGDSSYEANWFVQSSSAYDDESAVQSGALNVPEQAESAYYSTWLKTTLPGKGVLSFQWKCAAKERYRYKDEFDTSGANDVDSGDALRFGLCTVDGTVTNFTEIARLEGTTDWKEAVYTNSAAEAVTLAWVFQYKRGEVGPSGEGQSGGTGWVDRVTWAPEGGTPVQEYFVSFNANGGAGEMSDQIFTNDVAAALASNAFTKDGHTFAGWATVSDGAVAYVDGAEVSNLTDVADETVTLYAVWTPNQYTITFRDREEDIASTTQAYGTEVSAPADLSRTGYAFAGWTPAAPATVPASNVICVAQWTPNTYTVTFDKNGGEGEMAGQAFTYDLVSSLSSNVFTKSDSTFDGWAMTSDGDVAYADGASVSNLTAEANGAVTLYAHWTATGGGDPDPGPVEPEPEWTVTFVANGGAGEMAEQTFTNGVEQALSSNAFVRTGYAFAGWATESDGAVVYADGQAVTLATNTTLYAAWTANTYTVAFDKNGGEGEMSDQAFTYDLVSCLTSNVFTKSDSTFDGWATTSDGDVVYADGAAVSNLTAEANGVVTLYAHWTEAGTPDDPDPVPVAEIAFADTALVVDEGSNVVMRVCGGNAEKASSVKVYLAYNTAAAADLDLAHGSVTSAVTKLVFPLTLKWAAGEVGEKAIEIPVRADALVEGEEFFTLQLAAASGAAMGAQTVCTVRIVDAQWDENDIEASTAAAIPAGATTVTSVSGAVMGYFTKKNSKGNVTAKAMPGYVFVGWVFTKGGKTFSTKATISDKLRKAKKVQPKFAVAHVLRGLADPANGGKVTGSGKYARGKTVVLKATPTKYWSFEGWFAADDSGLRDGERRLSKSTSYRVSATNDATYFAAFKPYPKVRLAVDNASSGTVKGAGSYKTGTKVTLKATPKKGYAFTGWWRVVVDAEGVPSTNRVSLASSYAYKVTAEGLSLTATFKKESALAKPALTWGGTTNLTVGVSYSAKLSVAGESAVSITKVTGLPAGLAYKSGKVSGVPTTKKVYTAKVTVALKSNAKKTWTYSVRLNVAALPAWAAGKTFRGTLYSGEGESATAKGTVTLTVGKTGKVSGKFVNTKKTAYAYTASSFRTYGEDGVLRTKATLKYGKKNVTLDVAVGAEEVIGEDSSTSLRGFAEIGSAAAPFSGGTVTLR